MAQTYSSLPATYALHASEDTAPILEHSDVLYKVSESHEFWRPGKYVGRRVSTEKGKYVVEVADRIRTVQLIATRRSLIGIFKNVEISYDSVKELKYFLASDGPRDLDWDCHPFGDLGGLIFLSASSLCAQPNKTRITLSEAIQMVGLSPYKPSIAYHKVAGTYAWYVSRHGSKRPTCTFCEQYVGKDVRMTKSPNPSNDADWETLRITE